MKFQQSCLPDCIKQEFETSTWRHIFNKEYRVEKKFRVQTEGRIESKTIVLKYSQKLFFLSNSVFHTTKKFTKIFFSLYSIFFRTNAGGYYVRSNERYNYYNVNDAALWGVKCWY